MRWWTGMGESCEVELVAVGRSVLPISPATPNRYPLRQVDHVLGPGRVHSRAGGGWRHDPAVIAGSWGAGGGPGRAAVIPGSGCTGLDSPCLFRC
jgi:hypothetical protein